MLGAVLNILLDPVFIFLLDLGVRGGHRHCAQPAGQLPVRASLPVQSGAAGAHHLRWIQPAHHAGRILLTGLTPFVIIAVDNVMIIALNAVLQRYGGPEQGDLLGAAAPPPPSFLLVVTMPLGGITSGTASILGYNLGPDSPRRILEAQKYTLLLSLAYTTTLCLVGLLLAAPFTHIFTPDPQVSALAVTAIRIFSIGVIPLAVQFTIVEGLNGMG